MVFDQNRQRVGTGGFPIGVVHHMWQPRDTELNFDGQVVLRAGDANGKAKDPVTALQMIDAPKMKTSRVLSQKAAVPLMMEVLQPSRNVTGCAK